jgi:hypothetical protein
MNQKYRVHLFNSVFIDETEEDDKGAGALLLSRLAESSNRPLDVTSARPTTSIDKRGLSYKKTSSAPIYTATWPWG